MAMRKTTLAYVNTELAKRVLIRQFEKADNSALVGLDGL